MPQGHDMRRALLLALAAIGLVGHALVFDFVNDDAFISFRYADNLVRHGELVFNPGERVEGYTNFLWTMLMAGVLALGLPIVPLAKWLGIAFALGTFALIARFTARHVGQPSAWDALAPALLAAAPAYACWSTGGLETQMFTFFATLGWTAFLAERQAADREGERPGEVPFFPKSGIWFGISAMARPEGMLFFGLTGLHRLLEMLLVDRTIKPTRSDWKWGFGFAGAFVPYFAWRFWYYGWPFPNTYYVKTGAKNFWAPGARYVGDWALKHLIVLVPVFGLMRRGLPGRRERRLITLGLLYIVAIALHVMRVGGDFMALHRFMVPIMPVCAVLVALGVRRTVERLLDRGTAPWIPIVAGVVIAAGMAVGIQRIDSKALEVGSDRGVDSIGWLSMFHHQTAAIGKHLAKTADPDASIAVTAAGIIPFYSRLYTLDVLGLNDEWIAHNVEARGNRPGHTKSAPLQYILDKDIDYIIYHPTIAERRPGQGRGQRRAWKRRGYEWKAEQVEGLDPPWWGYWKRIAPPGE